MTNSTANKPASLYGNLTFIFGMIAIILALWASFIVMALGPKNALVLLHIKDYQSAVFVVEKLVFVKGQRSVTKGSNKPNKYWAEGNVDGKAEIFTLGNYVKGIPINQEQLESHISVGQVLPVLYNPSISESTDVRVRVLYPKENFPEYWQNQWKNIFRVGYLPMGIALLICIVCSVLAKCWSGLKFTITSIIISLSGWIFVFHKVWWS
jgi:hypothetical protein